MPGWSHITLGVAIFAESGRGIIGVMTDVNQILSQIKAGDPLAAELLLPLVYDELRSLAAARLTRENPGHTLQPTALVHEAYLRLVGCDPGIQWDGCGHFFAAAAEAMRRILIDHARSKKAARRGGSARQVEFEAVSPGEIALDERLIALDDALAVLERIDKTKAELVRLRYFAGLTATQAAEVLGISVTTANRYWAYARAWLYERLRSGSGRD